jgi:hypothetical protein
MGQLIKARSLPLSAQHACGNPHHDLRASNTHVVWCALIQPQ